jgi:polysaccharide pyruvyl transferase WcaK-like protein
MLGKPVISLGYAKKNDVLMAEMGLGIYCQSIEEFTVEQLKEQFLILIETLDQARAQLQRKTADYRQVLDEQYRLILQEAPATATQKAILPLNQTESVNL